MLFGGDGFQVQLLGKYNIPFFSASVEQFTEKMCQTVPSEFKQFRTKAAVYAEQIAREVLSYKQ